MTALHTMDEAAGRLAYDPATGIFTWRVKPAPKVRAGAVAGKIRADGYRIIGLAGTHHYAHRLAFWFGHGRMPTIIDHINGNRDDNRLINLREVTASQNTINQGIRADNTSGFKGVQYSVPHKKWRARIKIDGLYRSLGYFDSAEVASAAYDAAAQHSHGPFARQK